MLALLLGCAVLMAGAAEESAAAKPKTRASAPITALSVSPDGKHLIVGSQDGVRLFLLEQVIAARKIADKAHQVEPNTEVHQVQPSLEGMNVHPSATIPTELEHVHDVCFSSTGDRMVLAGGSPGEQGVLEIYAWPSGELLNRTIVHDDVVYGVDFDAGGDWIATASGDETARLLRLPDLDQSIALAGHSQRALDIRFLPDRKQLVTVSVDQTIRVWSVETGKPVRTLSNHLADVTCVEVRPRETRLAMIATTSADNTVRLWQPTIGRMVRFKRLETEPLSLAWNSDGRLLWIGCADGQLAGMAPETAKLQCAIQVSAARLNQLAVSPDGEWIYAGDSRGRLFCVSIQIAMGE